MVNLGITPVGSRELRGRNFFMWMLIVAMLFNGGLIPWFLVIRNLGMLNSLWALILPGALPIWNVILLMNFFRDIPQELEEAAIHLAAVELGLVT